MKKVTFFSVSLIALCLFVITSITLIGSVQAAPLRDNPLIEGCIGACGEPFSTSYTVPKNGVYCFTTTDSSLCPNTGAEVKIYQNGELILKTDMTYGVFFKINAKKRDIITIEANLFGINSCIQCIWLGELYFQLEKLEKDL